MMLKRTLTALVIAPVLLILLLCPPWVIAIFLAAISVTGVMELLAHWKNPVRLSVKILAGAYTVAFLALIYFQASTYLYIGLTFLLVFLLFLEIFRVGDGFDFGDLCGVFFAAAAIPALYSPVLSIALMENPKYLVLMPFLVTIISDVFALFSGMLFGKHKLAPKVSPNKTIEGAIGGYLMCLAVQLLYAWVLNSLFFMDVNWHHFLLYGVVCGIVSQLGDLAMSAVKRNLSIKDFGKIFPGHGGILDRFDSLLFVAPTMLAMLTLFPPFKG